MGDMSTSQEKSVHRMFWVFTIALICAFAAVPAPAQVLYGSIVGNVRDASGAAVPNASVTIVNKETNQSRSTVTNEEGGYSFPTVSSGTYEVKVTKEGFRPAAETNLAVMTNSVARADLTLQVGAVNESVFVTGAAQLLQTDRSARPELSESVRYPARFHSAVQRAFDSLEPVARPDLQRQRHHAQLSECPH